MNDAKTKKVASGTKIFNPFPGLRPFSIEESHLFFGREGQSEEVLEHLASNKFVAVIGASGSGKSSLLYCGVIPILHGGFITKAGSNWRIVTSRPGSNPVDNLASAIAKSEENPGDSFDFETRKAINMAVLGRSSKGLVEAIKQSTSGKKENTLVVIDQFEELFRYKRSTGNETAINNSELFVKLLVEAAKQSEVPIYIVLTMRSDFIGDCSQFQELTRLINDSNYLVPQMTRDDFKQAITGPVAVGGAKIENHLLHQLLNEVSDNPDQLPILQHALMRTWDYWMAQGDYSRPINLGDYEAIGKMESALSEHANEAFDELDLEEKDVCQVMFKTITEKGNDNRGVRHPSSIRNIASISKSDPDKVIKVANVFRASGRSFLYPSVDVELVPESIIDLSHESLMRIWDRLKIWVDEEAQAVQMYNRLSEAAALYQQGKTGLWRPPDLHLAVSWRNKQKPTLTWAKRYNPAFERTMVYLETSEKEFVAEEENKIKLQKRQLRRTRIFAMVLGSAAIIALGITLYAFQQRQQAEKNAEEAREQREKAEQKTIEAEEQTQLAIKNEAEAKKNLELANEQREAAEQQRRLALTNEQRAKEQERIARENLKLAEEQRLLALTNEEEARKQSLKAQEASEEAFNRRMLSIAQSMSVKSLQIDRDPALKALVAYQAYIFNKQYHGIQHHPDIYAGLFYALKANQPEGFNELQGHRGAVNDIVFGSSPDWMYSAGGDGTVLHWNLKGAVVSDTLVQNRFINRSMAKSNNGKYLAIGTSESKIQLINLENKVEAPIELIGHEGVVLAVDFLDPSTLISCASDKKLMIWNLDDQSFKLISEQYLVRSMDISPDGKYLFTGTDNGRLVKWSLSDFSSETIYNEPGVGIYSLSFTSEGKLLATGHNDGLVRIWNLPGMELRKSLSGHASRVNEIKFSPGDNLLATCSNGGTARIWDMKDLNNQPVVLNEHDAFVLSLAFSPDGSKLVTTSNRGNNMLIWPTSPVTMANQLYKLLSRDMTNEEWEAFVASDIKPEQTTTIKPDLSNVPE